jgi:hypothetical protein
MATSIIQVGALSAIAEVPNDGLATAVARLKQGQAARAPSIEDWQRRQSWETSKQAYARAKP